MNDVKDAEMNVASSSKPTAIHFLPNDNPKLPNSYAPNSFSEISLENILIRMWKEKMR